MFGACTPVLEEMVSNHPSIPPRTSQDSADLYHTPLVIPFPGRGAVPHREAAPELGSFLLPFSEPLSHPSRDGCNGESQTPMQPPKHGPSPAHAATVFLFSPCFFTTRNIHFSAFSAPDIMQKPLNTTPEISLLGGDALVRAHHWATSIRAGFCWGQTWSLLFWPFFR